MCSKEESEEDYDPVMTKVKSIKSTVKSIQQQMAQYLSIKNDFNQIIRINEKISKALPKQKISKQDKRRKPLILLIKLIKVTQTENPNAKAEGIRKINKILKRIKYKNS